MSELIKEIVIKTFRGHQDFEKLLKAGTIKSLLTVIIVDQERYLVDGDGRLVSLEADEFSFDPVEILVGKDWSIEDSQKKMSS